MIIQNINRFLTHTIFCPTLLLPPFPGGGGEGFEAVEDGGFGLRGQDGDMEDFEEVEEGGGDFLEAFLECIIPQYG